jgi:hypothetical protein
MKLNISRITSIVNDYKPKEDIILKVYKEKGNYISYTLIESKSTDRKLVLKNDNHRKLLHKDLIFEHFYIVLVLTLSLSIYQLVKGNYIMPLLLLMGGALLMLKLLRESDVPYKLIFEGLTIYELNHVGKRIVEFNPSIIESSDSNEYENDFIFLATVEYSRERKSLIIMEGFSFEVRDLFNKFYQRFNFKNSIKARGQL